MSHGGVRKFDGLGFSQHGKESGLSDDMVFSSLLDRAGTLWLGGDRGELCLMTRDPETGVTIAPFRVDGRTFEHILFVTADAAGDVWFGGGAGQLYRYDGVTLVDLSSKR